MAIASWVATSRAMLTCSAGNVLGSPPKLTAPISSPPAIIGIAM